MGRLHRVSNFTLSSQISVFGILLMVEVITS